MIYGRVMSIFLLFTGCEISEQTSLFYRFPHPVRARFCFPDDSKQPELSVWSTVIESMPQETRTFVPRARRTMLTSQLETTLSLSALFYPTHHPPPMYHDLSVPILDALPPFSYPLRTFSVLSPLPTPPAAIVSRNITRL